jgi:hypothetical protein
MLDVVKWLIVNTVLPLLPVAFFYLVVWLKRGVIEWIPPIRDGQICFYSTIIAILAMKDIFGKNPTDTLWFFSLVGCWLVSTVVYSISVYSTINPEGTKADRQYVDKRIAKATIWCGLLTTLFVVVFRINFGVLK